MDHVQVSSKLRRATNGYMWFCPACEEMHPLPDGWKFDGNLEQPTFEPSFRHSATFGPLITPPKVPGPWCCHYVVTAGVVHYCGDCTHAMNGQSIPMPELPELYRDV